MAKQSLGEQLQQMLQVSVRREDALNPSPFPRFFALKFL